MPGLERPTLRRDTYEPEQGARTVHGRPDAVRFVMPFAGGRLRLLSERATELGGSARPGMVWVLAPERRLVVVAGSVFDVGVLDVPLALLPSADAIAAVGPVVPSRPELRGLCPGLISAVRLAGEQRDAVVLGLATALVWLLLTGVDGEHDTDPRLSERELRAAEAYAESRLTMGVDLLAWASALDLPERVFSRRFRNSTGATPYAWFLDRRLDEAVRLLETSDLRIVEIASQVGFSSQSHFSDTFRTRMGTSPGRWRRARALA